MGSSELELVSGFVRVRVGVSFWVRDFSSFSSLSSFSLSARLSSFFLSLSLSLLRVTWKWFESKMKMKNHLQVK